MKARVLSYKEEPTKDGQTFMVLLKDEAGKTYRTWVVLYFRNFKNWSKIFQPGFDYNTLYEITHPLNRPICRKPGEIDADCIIEPVPPSTPESRSYCATTATQMTLQGYHNYEKGRQVIKDFNVSQLEKDLEQTEMEQEAKS